MDLASSSNFGTMPFFKYSIYPYINWILPYLKALKGDRPSACLPNKEILNVVSSKWQNSGKIDSCT